MSHFQMLCHISHGFRTNLAMMACSNFNNCLMDIIRLPSIVARHFISWLKKLEDSLKFFNEKRKNNDNHTHTDTHIQVAAHSRVFSKISDCTSANFYLKKGPTMYHHQVKDFDILQTALQ